MSYNVNNISPEQNRNPGPNKTQIIDVRMSEMSALLPTRICPEQQATSHWEEGGGWVEAAASVPFCRGSLMSVGVPFRTLADDEFHQFHQLPVTRDLIQCLFRPMASFSELPRDRQWRLEYLTGIIHKLTTQYKAQRDARLKELDDLERLTFKLKAFDLESLTAAIRPYF